MATGGKATVDESGAKSKEISQKNSASNLMRKLSLAAQVDADDKSSATEVLQNVAARIENAETLDDLFEAQSGAGGMDSIIGRIVTIEKVTFRLADEKYRNQPGSVGHYVVMSGFTEGGEEFTVSTGASNVVFFLFKADDKGLLPARMRFTSRETANGTLITVARP